MSIVLIIMLLLPLLGAITNGLVIRSTCPKKSGTIATLAAGASFLMALILWIHYLRTETPVEISFDWFAAGGLNLTWGFSFDALTAVMALVVTGIGSLIHLYSIGYMGEDKTPSRYFAYLNLFLFAMLMLISADNLPVLFLGWEGVGFCSYVLIGYWYEDIKKADAGMKAFIINRIGDAGFLIGIFICYGLFGSLHFQTMADVTTNSISLDARQLELAALFLFIGAMGKSAQIPLHTWLPDAMAGPTPVSALIHAATMVTAGVYLVARMVFLYEIAGEVSTLIAIIGCLTALFAASIATAQRDIKKVLAYSTVSQLGFMFLALGVGAYSAAIFHLMTHAFFKGLLFLGAGSIIHALNGEQDICNMGGLRNKLPWTFLTFTVAVVAISGLPPLSGFFSKDTIVFAALAGPNGNSWFWALASFSSLLTAFYMSRLYFLVFFGDYRGKAHPHESPSVMVLPLVVLAVGSIFAGFLGVPHGLHIMPNYLDSFLLPILPQWSETHTFLTEFQGMGIAIVIAILGILIAYLFYVPTPARSEKMARKMALIDTVLKNKYWIDELYELIFISPFRLLSKMLARFFEPYIIDAAVLLPTRIARVGATILSFIQAGSAQFYLWIMLLGGLVVFWISTRGLGI